MRRFLSFLIEFLFPRRCLGCGLSHTFLCSACLSKIPRSPDQWIHEPGWVLDGLFVIAPYTQHSLLQKCIQTLKYRHAYALGMDLGGWMAEKWPGMKEATLIPVPLHKKREQSRGYNQARLLAECVSEYHQLPIWEGLMRVRNTPPQARLPRNERLQNIANSFYLSGEPSHLNKKIVLIDDVCSTGATFNECAKVLKAHGADSVWGLVLARGSCKLGPC